MKKTSTILVHGSLFPLISYYCHGVSCPEGITLAKDLPRDNTLGRMARILSQAAPDDFDLDRFYVFGWAGTLNSTQRMADAKKLLSWLLEHPDEDFTFIGHSHGATLLMYLAQLTADREPLPFSVQKLIVMACPVQKVTAPLIRSPLFKRVYSLYSARDIAQICEPQDYLWYVIPLLSKRVFEPADNLMQSEIVIKGTFPEHNDFLLHEEFLRSMPSILAELDQLRAPIDEHHKNRFKIDLLEANQIVCTEILQQPT